MQLAKMRFDEILSLHLCVLDGFQIKMLIADAGGWFDMTKEVEVSTSAHTKLRPCCPLPIASSQLESGIKQTASCPMGV